MRVGLAIETDSPGGAETMLLELARELQARGVEVFALGPAVGDGWLRDRFGDLGIERESITFRGPLGLGSVSEIASIIARHRLDVLHSHEFMMAVLGALAAKREGCRHVITMHGGDYYTRKYRRRLALRFATALSSHTVAISDDFRDGMVEFLHLGPGSIQLIHNGVASVVGSGGAVREELGVGPDEVLVLAVGSLYPVKGHEFLLRAMTALPASGCRVVTAIAGTGFEESRLRELATSLGINDVVQLLGYRSDIPDLLDAADVFVMPSLSEGLPMAMIEAMLAGKPIVASDVGGIPELLSTTDVGILVPPRDPEGLANALGRVISDPELRRRLGSAARARAQTHFTSSAMADRYLELYSG